MTLSELLRPSITVSLLMVSLPSLSNEWSQVKEPTTGSTYSVGSYSNGCLSGAQIMPPIGDGYQVLRPQRKRYFGHSSTIDYLDSLIQRTQSLGIKQILIADIGMARGGLFTSGHRSHQTGLDIDIWYRLPEASLPQSFIDKPKAISLVDIENYKIDDKNWHLQHFSLIKAAASDDQVSRIFVHPVIKEKLCATERESTEWLRKVRPWFGHNSHMHVRLKCPEKDSLCIDQALPPKGDGCGEEVASWRPKPNEPKAKLPPRKKDIKKPEQCQAILDY
ncbi:penicillin-insensitive murein endopeptidase [Vibrio makurazakiensis]|uniref:penicillin-insensitive murein endopeptidase n=1 Tax=Vibrio makurazakiensis TaxID=2910250 RepID=UPI003D0ABBBB